jgi:hypothetical protein
MVSLAGALALSLTTDVISNLLPLPDGMVAMLRWRWP